MKNKTVQQLLQEYAEIYAPGDKELYKVLSAIALAESGGNPNAIGDGGNSIGVFQANMAGGRGQGHTKENLFNPDYNIKISMPELFAAYSKGRKMGLVGRDLVAYVSRTAQRPKAGNEQHAAKNYGKYVGETPVSTNEPQMMLGTTVPTLDPKGSFYERPSPFPTRTPEVQAWTERMIKENQKPMWQRAIEYFNPFYTPEASASEIASQVWMKPTAFYPKNYTSQRTDGTPYTVRAGDTLWEIAQRTLGSGSRWKEIGGYTGDPRSLPVGQRVSIPITPKPIYAAPMSRNIPMTPVSANVPQMSRNAPDMLSGYMSKPQPTLKQRIPDSQLRSIQTQSKKPNSLMDAIMNIFSART